MKVSHSYGKPVERNTSVTEEEEEEIQEPQEQEVQQKTKAESSGIIQESTIQTL